MTSGQLTSRVRRPLVEVSALSLISGDRLILDSVDLELDENNLVGIVGPSGAGKTTLLRAIAGTLKTTAGAVVTREGARVAYVPQVETVDWSFPITVGECVLMGRTGRRLPWPTRADRAASAAVLARLGLDGLGDRHIGELSGGQQRRVFVARALLREPDLLLLDEPTSGVDVALRHELLHLLDEIRGDGTAIVLTTHDLNGVAAHLPRIVCLNRRVIACGSPAEVLTPDNLEELYGASMSVLEHGGMRLVVDSPAHTHTLFGEPVVLTEEVAAEWTEEVAAE